MKITYIRSPYIINIDELSQTNTKLELFMWNEFQSAPTEPTYTFTKIVASNLQRSTDYNVSNYIKEFIYNEPIFPQLYRNMWCFFKVKRYKSLDNGVSYTLLTSDPELDDVTQVAVNGFTTYQDGLNKQDTLTGFLFNTDIRLSYNLSKPSYFVNFLTEYVGVQHTIMVYDKNNTVLYTNTFTPTFISNLNIGIGITGADARKLQIAITGVATVFEFLTEGIEECKYTPVVCCFINRYGGWQPLTFYKQQTTNISTTSTDYKMFQSSSNYNPTIGQYNIMNANGKKTIKLNTGWVSQDYYELIEDLLLSEIIKLDDVPVILKTKSSELKTHIKDKLINYEIEFEYAFDIINNMI